MSPRRQPTEDTLAATDPEISLAELSKRIKRRIDWGSETTLLDSDPLRLRDDLQRFRRRALAQLREAGLDAETRSAARSMHWALAEVTFERQEQHTLAGAFHALAHDHGLRGPEAAAAHIRLMHRFKLAWNASMARAAGDSRSQQRHLALCLANQSLLSRCAAQLESPWKEVLTSKIEAWLAREWSEAGEFEHAAEAYERAVAATGDPAERLEYELGYVQALEKSGRPQQALEYLLRNRKRYESLENIPEDSLQLLETITMTLRLDLGGRFDSSNLRKMPAMGHLMELLNEVESKSVVAADASSYLESLRESSAQIDERDPDLLHASLLHQALLVGGSTGDIGAAESLLDQAALLEPYFDSKGAELKRADVLALLRCREGDIDAAAGLYTRIWPEAREVLDLERCLDLAGNCLLVAPRRYRVEWVFELVDFLLEGFVEVLGGQPQGRARRRKRTLLQRPLESAIIALAAVEEDLRTSYGLGQEALRRAWKVIMAGRNLELIPDMDAPEAGSAGKSDPASPWLHEAEVAFHRSLREGLLSPRSSSRAWETELEALTEALILHQKNRLRPKVQLDPPADETIHVAFFQGVDLFKDQPLLVLLSYGGVLALRVLGDETPRLDETLSQWAALLLPERPKRLLPSGSVSRGSRPVGSADVHDLRAAPVWSRLLPESAESLLDPRQVVDWHLYPDGLLSGIPFEMLPLGEGRGRLGQVFPVSLCLRPRQSETVEAGDRAGAWLGLGDVPAVGSFGRLPQTATEIRELADHLQELGWSTGALLGEDARADLLEAELRRLSPSVLHFALHGTADRDHPEACALILAPPLEPHPECRGAEPGGHEIRPEGELLPFRQISKLPLESVDLVVLSACNSSTGRSDRSSTMEGLAWAFLSCGVRHVVATRYVVDDAKAVHMMLAFYSAAQEVPVPEALSRARDRCLREGRIRPEDAAAWCVWS